MSRRAMSFHLHLMLTLAVIGTAGCRGDEGSTTVGPSPASQAAVVPAPAVPDSEVVARAVAFGALPCDPLATAAALSAVAVVHGPIAVRPGTGALVLARPDARVPLGPGAGDLALVRGFRHLPSSAPGGPWSVWDLHFGLGPASVQCSQGASCDDEGRVLAFNQGGRRLDVRWEEGHPVAIAAGGDALVTFAWRGGSLETLSFAGGGGTVRATVRYGHDDAGRLIRVAGPNGVEAMAYDDAGRPTRLAGEGAMALTLSWDGQGRVTSLEGPEGDATRLSYREEAGRRVVDVTRQGAVWRYTFEASPGGTTARWTNPAGHEETRRFDARGRLVGAETAEGAWRVTRDAASGLLSGLDGPGGCAVSLGRDPAARVQAVTAAKGAEEEVEVRIERDAAGGIKALSRRSRGREETARFDEDGPATAVRLGDALVAWLSRDAAGRIAAIESGEARWSMETTAEGVVQRDPLGDQRRWRFDAAGRPVEATARDGEVERWRWREDGALETHTDVRGVETRWHRDAAGRPVRVEVGGVAVTTLRWNGRGELVSMDTQTGRTTFQWDALGRLSARTGEDGVVERYTWDAAGHLTGRVRAGETVWRGTWREGLLAEERDDGGVRRLYTHDRLGRVTEVRQEAPGAPPRTTRLDWGLGGAVTMTDAETGERWQWGPASKALEALGVSVHGPQTALHPSGAATSWRHGPDGLLRERAEAGGGGTTWEWDLHGRVRRVETRGSGGVSLSWDGSGRLASARDDAGMSYVFKRDDLGRVTVVTGNTGTWRYERDEAGRLTAIVDPVGRRRRFTYDPRGRLTGIAEAWQGEAEARLDYDGNGRVVRETGPDGALQETRYEGDRPVARVAGGETLGWRWQGELLVADTGPRHAFEWASEDGGRALVEKDETRGVTARQEVDAAGRPLRLTVEGAFRHEVGWRRRADGLVKEVRATGFGAVTYAYDAVGRRASAVLPGGGRIVWVRDAVGRIEAIVGQRSDGEESFRTTFERDEAGRIVRETVGGAALRHTYDTAGRLSETGVDVPGQPARTLGFGWDASGTLTRLRGEDVELDAGGRVDTVGGRRRRWNARGAMESREAGGQRWTLVHDAHGRLLSAKGEGRTITWELDGQGRLLSRQGDDGRRHRHFFRGALLAARGAGPEVLHVPGDAAGERVGAVTDGEARYFIQRPDGTIAAGLRGDGTVAAAALFDPFGEIVMAEGEGAGEDWYRGRYRDPEVGLIHYPLRWYDPDAGVFTAPDPAMGDLMAPSTLARFSYLEGDPVNRFDPSGAAGFEWEAGKMTLEGVCDLFQKGRVEASHAFGNSLDGFGYQGAIEKRGWVYDVWSKQVPGTNRVVTVIRDLNEKASGPYGKANISGNIVIGARPDNLQVARHLPANPPPAEGGGFMQRLGDLATQAKHGVQLYGKEVGATVATLGGVSGTLGSEVGLILSMPGGVGIVAVAVAGAGALGYGTGTLLNKIPVVQNLAQAFIGKAMGYDSDQAMADAKAELENMGDRAKEIRTQQMKDFQDKVAASGLPGVMPEPGVAGGTVDLGASPAVPPEPDKASEADLTRDEPAPGTAVAEGGDTGKRRTPRDDGDKGDPPGEAADEDGGAEDDEEEEDQEEGEDEDEPEPPTKPEVPGLLDLVTPVRITVSYGMDIDASHGEFKNVVSCKGTMSFWNVGALAPGYGEASFSTRCVASINGSESTGSGTGSFSGGPNGTVTYSAEGVTIRASVRGGRTISIPEVGTFPLSPANAFDNWPEKLP